MITDLLFWVSFRLDSLSRFIAAVAHELAVANGKKRYRKLH